MKILGIETSCDETAVAVVGDDRTIMANLVLSQLAEHEAFGGVVPEIAARAHLDHLDRLIAAAMADAGIGFDDLDGVAATCGPGLIGGVMVGMMAGKAIAAARGLPFIGVNHLEAHALTPRLTEDDIEFPYLFLLVSGGHTQILVAEDVGRYRLWGRTIDDAAGECFDKAAKLMGLPYPGGPHLESAAKSCENHKYALDRFSLPRPMKGRAEPDFSFSGLKTAVRVCVEALPPGNLSIRDVSDLSFSFQTAMAEVVADRCRGAMRRFQKEYKAPKPTFIVCGGVAANGAIRAALEREAMENGLRFAAPPVKLCADNGAMIAWAGIERLRRGMTDSLNIPARPRWPLNEMTETACNTTTISA